MSKMPGHDAEGPDGVRHVRGGDSMSNKYTADGPNKFLGKARNCPLVPCPGIAGRKCGDLMPQRNKVLGRPCVICQASTERTVEAQDRLGGAVKVYRKTVAGIRTIKLNSICEKCKKYSGEIILREFDEGKGEYWCLSCCHKESGNTQGWTGVLTDRKTA